MTVALPRPRHCRPRSLSDVAALLDLVTPVDLGAPTRDVTGVTLDSRAVRPGDVYAALPGANVHGATFARDALRAGAVAVVTDSDGASRIAAAAAAEPGAEGQGEDGQGEDSRPDGGPTDAGPVAGGQVDGGPTGAGPVDGGPTGAGPVDGGPNEVDGGPNAAPAPVLVVDRPRAHLGALAAYVYDNQPPRVTMVGITGTNGKTTTAYVLDSALRALAHVVGLIGTVETRIGEVRFPSARTTPEAPDVHALVACMREANVDTSVMEVSSHALTLNRVDGLLFDVAIFTNLSQDHLDLHKTMGEYFAAKARLFEPQRCRRAIICVDDEWGRRLAAQASVPVVTVGSRAETSPDYLVVGDPHDDGAFDLITPDGKVDLRTALPGAFNQVNTAVAYVALRELGIDPEAARAAVLTDPHVPGRMERVCAEPYAVVDFAHTPDAIAAALSALRARARGRLIAVLGAGGDRDPLKRAAMGAAAALTADVVVVTDDNPRWEDPSEIRGAVLAGTRVVATSAEIVEIADRRAAIRYAADAARAAGPDSVLAVLGKGHETGQDIAGVVHPFDDRAELAAALEVAGATQGRTQ